MERETGSPDGLEYLDAEWKAFRSLEADETRPVEKTRPVTRAEIDAAWPGAYRHARRAARMANNPEVAAWATSDLKMSIIKAMIHRPQHVRPGYVDTTATALIALARVDGAAK